MNIVYLALQYLPVGVAATIQLLGPLTVAISMSRKYLDIGWSLLAAIGLALFAVPSLSSSVGLPLTGISLAGLSAVSMGAYVLLSKKAGAASLDGRYLALALVWASALWCPFGIAADGVGLVHPGTFAMGFVVAVLSAAVPYSLELVALRKLSPRIVGTLQSLEPAVGSLAGLIVLSELLTPSQLIAVACVTVASVASVSTSRQRRSKDDQIAEIDEIKYDLDSAGIETIGTQRSTEPRAPNRPDWANRNRPRTAGARRRNELRRDRRPNA
ncbi:EamA family transporter [Rhodococcus sp. H29-C3]|uniref:EamA family transporter n=1 Tax=Rhodococcus sp. H29-C3 TaxID=3046307 RepID=UPI0024B8B96D|nr:EamA family transporter [Rhodococcus sp. H29-C3]MDJ0362541.1 EamA family transporter [Rhodococcus sp. H29-C3]